MIIFNKQNIYILSMKNLFEFFNEYLYDRLIINEVSNIIANEFMINESFKSSILQKLAKAIYDAEKSSNITKINRAKDEDERYGTKYGKHDPKIVSFASIFGPKTVNGNYGPSKKGVQGLKWSEISDDDFKEYAPDDKELIKLIKKTYGKKDGNADFIVMKGDEIINFIKAYGTDEKSDGMFYFKSDTLKKYKYNGDEHEYTENGGVKELTKPYYTYQHRPLKVGEVIDALKGLATIEGVKVYALEITSDMVQTYKTTLDDRAAAQKGVINYDKASLAMLRKNQVARYKALADEIRAKKLQSDPNVFWDEIKKTNDEVVALYSKIMSSPENIDKRFELGNLMNYVAYAYESFYDSVKSGRQYERAKERAKVRAAEKGEEFDEKDYDKWDFNKSDSKQKINDAKEYVDKVKKMIQEIEANLK